MSEQLKVDLILCSLLLLSSVVVYARPLSCAADKFADGCSVPSMIPAPFKMEFTHACNRHDICYGCVSFFNFLFFFFHQLTFYYSSAYMLQKVSLDLQTPWIHFGHHLVNISNFKKSVLNANVDCSKLNFFKYSLIDDIAFELFAMHCGIEREYKKRNVVNLANQLSQLRAPTNQNAFDFSCDIVYCISVAQTFK